MFPQRQTRITLQDGGVKMSMTIAGIAKSQQHFAQIAKERGMKLKTVENGGNNVSVREVQGAEAFALVMATCR